MLDILRKRRSIRRYKDKEIEPAIIEQLKEAALRSPRLAHQPLEIPVHHRQSQTGSTLPSQRERLKLSERRALGVVVCAKSDESDVWIEDCSIASIILQLTGQSLGLGSCWIQIRKRMHSASQSAEDYVKEVLCLSDDICVEAVIAFGYPDEVKPPVPEEELDHEKIILSR